jgi:hypothetical protein
MEPGKLLVHVVVCIRMFIRDIAVRPAVIMVQAPSFLSQPSPGPMIGRWSPVTIVQVPVIPLRPERRNDAQMILLNAPLRFVRSVRIGKPICCRCVIFVEDGMAVVDPGVLARRNVLVRVVFLSRMVFVPALRRIVIETYRHPCFIHIHTPHLSFYT